MASKWEFPDNPDRPFPYTAEQLDAILAEMDSIPARSEEFERNAHAAYSRETAERYPNRWVGAANGEIAAAAPTYTELQELLQEAGLIGAKDLVRNFTGPRRLTVSRSVRARA